MEAATGGVWERFHPRAILFNYGIPLLTASFTAGCAAGPNLLKDSLDLDVRRLVFGSAFGTE